MMPVIPLRAFVASEKAGAVAPVPIKGTWADSCRHAHWNSRVHLWHRGRL